MSKTRDLLKMNELLNCLKTKYYFFTIFSCHRNIFKESLRVFARLVHGNVIRMGWDRDKLQWDEMGMRQINMSHGQP